MTEYDVWKAWIEIEVSNNPDLGHADMRKHCSKEYPYAAYRKGYRYKCFLRAMRDKFGRAKRVRNKFGQMEMFE